MLPSKQHRVTLLVGALLGTLSALLSGCGGGGSDSFSSSNNSAQIASSTVQFGTDGTQFIEETNAVEIQPSFHAAPIVLTPPTNLDADGLSQSAYLPPEETTVPQLTRNLSTRRLTLQGILDASTGNGQSVVVNPSNSATPRVAVTYTPAQIRAAYGLPTLPMNIAGLSASQAAQLGANQTIYIVDAYHDAYAARELAAFSQTFGLPGCNVKTLSASAALPLPAPSSTSCDFYQVFSTPAGGLTSTVPRYDSGWAMEIALDVQWVHATAPLARIVLIEAPDTSVGSLAAAVLLANKMGPGVVSMSFGGMEGSYVTGLDSYFRGTGMTYFAATGDDGAGVNWPAVSPYVVASGGTTLSYNGSSPRYEVTWSGSGGGISAYEPKPAYQISSIQGLGSVSRRSVADVSFNADPYSGQYVAIVPNQTGCGSCQVSWSSVGGTSLATPQWAAIAAVANAMRLQSGGTLLGDPHQLLYTQVGGSSSNYLTNFYDVVSGNDGSCITCSARSGYDQPTGLGTPNGLTLLNALKGAGNAPKPPVVANATITGTANHALSFTASVVDANSYTLSLSGAPSGMTIASNGVVSWPAPLDGTYSVVVMAKDNVTGLTGQGVYKVVITGSQTPVVSSGTINGNPGTALSFSANITSANPYTLSLIGAPRGMTISSAGVVSWSSPVTGQYSVTVAAKDTRSNLTGTGVYKVVIATAQPKGPTLSATAFSSVGGNTLTGTITILDSTATIVGVTITGVPLGMNFMPEGGLNSLAVSWPNAVVGSYKLKVHATDAKGNQGELDIPVTVFKK